LIPIGYTIINSFYTTLCSFLIQVPFIESSNGPSSSGPCSSVSLFIFLKKKHSCETILCSIGQTKPCIIYRLVTNGTVEKKILDRAASKRKLEKLVIHKCKSKTLFNNQKYFFDFFI
jgi:hypothetical protein